MSSNLLALAHQANASGLEEEKDKVAAITKTNSNLMATYKQRVISTKFWSDSFVVDKLNPLDRYLFLYFLTNEKTNLAGVYELPLRVIANETGLEKEEITRMLKRLEGKVEYKDGWVCLVNFTKHQNHENKSIVKGIENRIEELPENVRVWVDNLRSGIPVVDESYTTTDNRNLKETKYKPNLKDMYVHFDKFWKEYPKKENKVGCQKKWVSKQLDKSVDKILDFIERAKHTDRWKKGYIKNPLTFLNSESWEDDLSSYNDIKKNIETIKL